MNMKLELKDTESVWTYQPVIIGSLTQDFNAEEQVEELQESLSFLWTLHLQISYGWNIEMGSSMPFVSIYWVKTFWRVVSEHSQALSKIDEDNVN